MRRLRQDWNEHGWRRDPQYDWNFGSDGPARTLSERTTLCACFDLRNKEALRFKDTPNQSSFRRRDWNLYRTGRGCDIPIQERRANQGEVERGPSRRRRDDRPQRVKILCRCGYLLRIVEVTRESHWRAYYPEAGEHCPDCARKRAGIKPIVDVPVLR